MSEATKDSKFCEDCKWHFYYYDEDNHFCTHPKLTPEQQYDYVIGPVPIVYSSCYGLRASGECGPEGKYWESPIKEPFAATAVGADGIEMIANSTGNNHVFSVGSNAYPESETMKFEDLFWEDAPKPKVSWWNWIRGKAD